jgi:hypothetical protein
MAAGVRNLKAKKLMNLLHKQVLAIKHAELLLRLQLLKHPHHRQKLLLLYLLNTMILAFLNG